MAGDAEQSARELVVVIMAGGAGTRFWPVSTRSRPKQFLRLLGERSLLQTSFDRVRALVPPHRLLVLTHAEFVSLVREQLPEVPEENVIGEPLRRDTAAAVCLGAVLCRRRFGNPVMAMLTADHVIEPEDAFHRVLLSAARHARKSGALYTFGIPPTFPATGAVEALLFGGLGNCLTRERPNGPETFAAHQEVDSASRLAGAGLSSVMSPC